MSLKIVKQALPSAAKRLGSALLGTAVHEETAAHVGTGGPVVTGVRVEIVEHVEENSLIAAGAVAATAAHSHLSKASAASSIRLLCSRIQDGVGCRHQGFKYE